MEPVSVEWLSLLPPLIAIVLALLTKEVITSLLVGILSGAVIYSLAAGLNPVVGPVETTFTLMAGRMDVSILLFLALLGALVAVIGRAGGVYAYGQWAGSKLKSKRGALLATSLLGIAIFIDDYFNCLTVGTVMKPVTDKFKISREKLAYVIDATAAPICILAPVSSWAVAVGSNLKATGRFESDLAAFAATIPYNLYALLSVGLALFLCVTSWDFGPMRIAEERAQTTGRLGNIDAPAPPAGRGAKGKVADMLLPVGALIFFSLFFMLYGGGYWGPNPAYHSIAAAFGNCNSSQALVMASFCALLVAFVQFVPRGVVSFQDFMSGITEGVQSMVSADIILILAWTISGVCRDLLQTGEFVKTLVEGSALPIALLPAVVFVVAALLSFATGTAWGTFGILIPIVVPVCVSAAPGLLIVSLSAVLAGSVFGDHCSPISDTTILSSTGAGVGHLAHVSTQLVYSMLVAGCCIAGYLAAGFTGGALAPTWAAALAALALAVAGLHLAGRRKNK